MRYDLSNYKDMVAFMASQNLKFKFYFASSFARKDEAIQFSKTIERECNASCTSRWMHRTNTTYAVSAQYGKEDHRDIAEADIMVQLTMDPTGKETRGGRHTEFGIAMALNKHVYLIGEREQVFHYDENVCTVCQNLHECIIILNAVMKLVKFED